ncbi:MAG: hypothetical protein KIT76_09625 [Pseudolabrys sp.]|nr:hypothetical protein [Pseudolabrys sp.]
MKTLTTLTAAAALIAGMSIANAQTAPQGTTTNSGAVNAAPTGEGNTGKSGMQPKGSADMKGSATVKPGQQAQSENQADINKKPTDSGMAPKSGMQSDATKNMGSGSAKTPSATTGSGASSTVNPNDKSTDNGKTKAKDLAK